MVNLISSAAVRVKQFPTHMRDHGLGKSRRLFGLSVVVLDMHPVQRFVFALLGGRKFMNIATAKRSSDGHKTLCSQLNSPRVFCASNSRSVEVMTAPNQFSHGTNDEE